MPLSGSHIVFWSPYLKKKRAEIERVQRRMEKRVVGKEFCIERLITLGQFGYRGGDRPEVLYIMNRIEGILGTPIHLLIKQEQEHI